MRGLTLRIAWHERRGLLRVECLRPIDLRTRWHAEFMIARTLAGHLRVLRLDRIREAAPL